MSAEKMKWTGDRRTSAEDEGVSRGLLTLFPVRFIGNLVIHYFVSGLPNTVMDETPLCIGPVHSLLHSLKVNSLRHRNVIPKPLICLNYINIFQVK
ncbi:hypothetical protein AOLI_G00131830 [Acnodon oligacanthus]